MCWYSVGVRLLAASLPPSPADSGVSDLDSASDDVKVRMQGEYLSSACLPVSFFVSHPLAVFVNVKKTRLLCLSRCVSVCLSLSRTRARARAHTHTHTHMHIRRYTHTLSLSTPFLSLFLSLSHSLSTLTLPLSLTHTHIHRRVRARAHTHTHTHALTLRRPPLRTMLCQYDETNLLVNANEMEIEIYSFSCKRRRLWV